MCDIFQKYKNLTFNAHFIGISLCIWCLFIMMCDYGNGRIFQGVHCSSERNVSGARRQYNSGCLRYKLQFTSYSLYHQTAVNDACHVCVWDAKSIELW